MSHFLRWSVFSVLFFGFWVGLSQARIQENKLIPPNIKNDFCGTSAMPAQFCKCAFHGQYCDRAGMDSGAADAYVQAGFQKFITKWNKSFEEGLKSRKFLVRQIA